MATRKRRASASVANLSGKDNDNAGSNPKRRQQEAPPRELSRGQSAGSDPSPPFLMILAPAKTLDMKPMEKNEPIEWTRPSCDVEKTQTLIQIMKEHAKSTAKLSKLLNISASLAQTAKTYWDEMSVITANDNNDEESIAPGKPCGFAFAGIVYQGLQIDTLSLESLEYLQKSLRIMDPLYGWLRPMDVIQPYRLEMLTKNVFQSTSIRSADFDKTTKLKDYWMPAISETIQKEAELLSTPTVTILNLASEEYSCAIDTKNDANHIRMVKVIFRHGGRVLAVHAKRARGLMAWYCAEHRVSSLKQLQQFDLEGYQYQRDNKKGKEEDESEITTLVFDRSVHWNK